MLKMSQSKADICLEDQKNPNRNRKRHSQNVPKIKTKQTKILNRSHPLKDIAIGGSLNSYGILQRPAPK